MNHHLHGELWRHLRADNPEEKSGDITIRRSDNTGRWRQTVRSPPSEENTACQHQGAALTRLENEGSFEQKKWVDLQTTSKVFHHKVRDDTIRR